MNSEITKTTSIYRDIQEKDYQIIADFSNINALSDYPIWCKTCGWDSERVSDSIQHFKDKGNKLVTQVHEIDGKLISAYGGWDYKDRTIFELGVVDPSLPDYFDVWRKDTAKLFKDAFDRGSNYIYIRLTDDQSELVPWQENELNMTRHHTYLVWTASKEEMQPYIDKYL